MTENTVATVEVTEDVTEDVPEIIIDSHEKKEMTTYGGKGHEFEVEVTTTTTISSLGEYTIKDERFMSSQGGTGWVYATDANGTTVMLGGIYRYKRSVASLDEAFVMAKYFYDNNIKDDFTIEQTQQLHADIINGRIGCAKTAQEQVKLLHKLVMECSSVRSCISRLRGALIA